MIEQETKIEMETRRMKLAAIRRAAEMLTDAEGAELGKIIAEGCERIDRRDWNQLFC